MLTDIKTWIEYTGFKVAEERFVSPPALPYVIFTEESEADGADNKLLILHRTLSIELYSAKIDRNAEEKIESLLKEKEIEFKKDRAWIDSEKFFQTVYDFYIIEKL